MKPTANKRLSEFKKVKSTRLVYNNLLLVFSDTSSPLKELFLKIVERTNNQGMLVNIYIRVCINAAKDVF